MKISAKVILITVGLLMVSNVFAEEEDIVDEEADIVDEAEDEAEVEEEPVDEVKANEEATGIIDPANYGGRVISRKKILTKNPAAGNKIEFEYTVYNVGNTDVSDVLLTDDTFGEEWIDAQKVEIKIPHISAGGKHSEIVLVVPKDEGKIKLAGAKVQYKAASEDSEDLVLYQSEGAHEGIVPIASAAHYARHVQSHLFDWLCFGLLAVPSTVLPYMAAQNTLTRYGKAKTA